MVKDNFDYFDSVVCVIFGYVDINTIRNLEAAEIIAIQVLDHTYYA